MPLETFLDSGFLQNLCSFLEQVSAESIKEFAAHSNKAGLQTVEDRDTKDPALISSMLVALLKANGRLLEPVLLRKRIRDDVLWHNSATPWRRLPFWLIIRVAVQRHLLRQLCSSEINADRARVEYKFFVCLTLASLLDDVRNTTTPDRLSHIKAKLCRRLAKLDVEMETGSPEAVQSYNYCRTHLEKRLEHSCQQADACLRLRWDILKKDATRIILPLPRRAEPEALTLSFRAGSVQYLRQAVNRFRNSRFLPPGDTQRDIDSDSKPRSNDILEPYFKLAESESLLQQDTPSGVAYFAATAERINKYIGNVGDLYEFSVEQKSIMLLTVMELWMRLDEAACKFHPLIGQYHPFFAPEILDVLHLSQWTDMRRLRRIQVYLKLRVQCSSSLTIFDSPREGCFAQRFFDETPETHPLRKLLDRIKRRASDDRQAKEAEWAEKQARFETLTRQISRSVCTYLPDMQEDQMRRHPGPMNHDPECPKCKMESQLNIIRIGIFEEPLPSDTTDLMAKVAVFELGGYPEFQEYRDVTYFIGVKFGTEKLEQSIPPKCSAREYVQLQEFAKPNEPSFRLASTTKSCK